MSEMNKLIEALISEDIDDDSLERALIREKMRKLYRSTEEKSSEVAEKYPEHHKMSKISKQSEEIGSFIEWLESEKDLELVNPFGHYDHCAQVRETEPGEVNKEECDCGGVAVRVITPIGKLLAEYFEIDLHQLEIEKTLMLAEMRNANA